MESNKRKRGHQQGAKLSKEHREAISRGHKGLLTGSGNGNYKEDRTQLKVGVTSFTLTADVADWLKSKKNRSQYILELIREDMKKNQKNEGK